MIKTYSALVRVLTNIAGILVALIFLGVFAEVVGRNLFNVSIPAMFELSVFLLVFTAFVAAAAAFGQGTHFKVFDLAGRLNGTPHRITRLVADLCSVSFLIVLGWFGIKLALSQMDQPSAALKIPYGLIYMSLPIFAVLSVVLLVMRNLAPVEEIDAVLADFASEGE
ncbi:TRAP transporter small permease [Thiosulfatihalobacter marinus]|uniref:TRAP transporter small permease n=1 Tax=Thiosulfatihalobacter marinus TaxID=2792481 RepID=UPI0018D9973E|nr:TRAP transporter small permease subunit [Thiosulfatihalobacter marinus]